MTTPRHRHVTPDMTSEEHAALLREISALRSAPLATLETGLPPAQAGSSTIAIHTAGCWSPRSTAGIPAPAESP